ncbi:hypothetical protein GCM10011335_49070 [Aureimonas glaciei]|uniref:Uncharacterized protein n=1 Tax=Aureimonas glaciei TaxID=1776957 RepID=A0A917DIR4_9HYPH|nr:hypothetical protein GCM10011335_49070 [Aureimonas glaciei]
MSKPVAIESLGDAAHETAPAHRYDHAIEADPEASNLVYHRCVTRPQKRVVERVNEGGVAIYVRKRPLICLLPGRTMNDDFSILIAD